MTGRFWWRALDAPASRMPVSGSAHSSHASGPGAWVYPGRRSANPGNTRPNTKLSVPRDQRRTVSGLHVLSRTRDYGALAVYSMVASAAVVWLAMSGQLTDLKSKIGLKLGLANQASAALVAVGFGIDQVSISGHRYTPDNDVYDALDLPNSLTFAGFDAAAALKRIERLAWVDVAQISRVFPGVLAVQIRERQPAAIWARGEKSYLIDATGRTLGPIASTTTWALPRISGEGASAETSILFTALARYPEFERNFAVGERVGERRWAVVFKNGSRLELGADREAEGLELAHANKDIARALLAGPVLADVRTPGRPVLRLLSAPEAKPTVPPIAEAAQ